MLTGERLRGTLAAALGLIAFAGLVVWFGIVAPQRQGEPQAVVAAAPSSPRITEAAPKADATRSAADDRAAQAGEGGQPAVPSFDVVRVEPSGDSVIAGRSAAGATIEMLRDGKSHARAMADASGLFALVPPPLAPGSHEIVLQSIAPDGTRMQSRESVTVVIDQGRKARPLVTLTSPDRPTVVLSSPQPPATRVAAAPTGPAAPQAAAPGAPAGARPAVKIGAVEAEQGGRLFVSANAAPGATVRLYLNETFIAPGGAGPDGAVSFAIGRGVRPGDYRVRLDDVDPVSGEVKSRAEVPFNVPAPLVAAAPRGQPLVTSSAGRQGASGAAPLPSSSPVRQGASGTVSQPRAAAGPRPAPEAENPSGASANASLVAASPAPALPASRQPAGGPADAGPVLVPEVNTALVVRGDNLWRISRRVYGQGTRYTVIYDANQAQIRNPHHIYPGQVFVLPPGEAAAAR